MAKIEVFAFLNGNYAVCKDGQQVPEVQGSWLLLIAERLKSAGMDPLEASITLPDGQPARFFVTSEGSLNWRIGNGS